VAVTKPGNLTVLHGTGAGLWKMLRLGTIAKQWLFPINTEYKAWIQASFTGAQLLAIL
jgi:hypothetical protein